jgi:hypothetical protein
VRLGAHRNERRPRRTGGGDRPGVDCRRRHGRQRAERRLGRPGRDDPGSDRRPRPGRQGVGRCERPDPPMRQVQPAVQGARQPQPDRQLHWRARSGTTRRQRPGSS